MFDPFHLDDLEQFSKHYLYLQLFVGVLVFYLHYLCLFAYSGVRHILCCVFCFVFLRFVSLKCPVLIAPSVFYNVLI